MAEVLYSIISIIVPLISSTNVLSQLSWDKRSLLQELFGLVQHGNLKVYFVEQVMHTREFEDGEVVVREADMGDEFFIIQKGTCHVYKLLPDRPTI